MKKRKNKSESGMMTVEAVLSMVPYILVIMGIISFINIFMIHNKIQYAMYQVSSELSAYTYLYQVLGIREADKALQEDADKETTEIDDSIEKTTTLLNDLSNMSSTVDGALDDLKKGNYETVKTHWESLQTEGEKTKEDSKAAINSIKDLCDDPMDLMRNLIYFGIERATPWLKTQILGAFEYLMMPKYLVKDGSNVRARANEYLLAAGVYNGINGLDFSEGQLFSDDEHRMIDMVVEYDVSIFMFKLFFKEPRIHIVQRCAVPAWLDGDGGTYTPKAAEEGKK